MLSGWVLCNRSPASTINVVSLLPPTKNHLPADLKVFSDFTFNDDEHRATTSYYPTLLAGLGCIFIGKSYYILLTRLHYTNYNSRVVWLRDGRKVSRKTIW